MILYIDGGARSAAFAHGVITRLVELGLKEPTAVVANSAGTVPAMAYLLNRLPETRDIFCDFCRRPTYFPHRLPATIAANAYHAVTGRVLSKHMYVGDLGEILQIMKDHQLHPERLPALPPLYVRVLHRNTGNIHMRKVDACKSAWDIIEQTGNCPPFVCARRYSNRPTEHVDAMISGKRDYEQIVQQFPRSTLLVIRNARRKRSILNRMQHPLEGMITCDWRTAPHLFSRFSDRRKSEQTLDYLAEKGQAIVIEPSSDCTTAGTVSREQTVRSAFEAGYQNVGRRVGELREKGVL